MKESNEKKLFKKYSKLFPHGRKVDPKKSLMNYGICVNEGWYNLIDKLCSDIQGVINKAPKVKQIQVIQVKEKFGGLRFYISHGTKEIFDLIHKAEAESFEICEDCGEIGKNIKTERGWLRTLCKSCKK